MHQVKHYLFLLFLVKLILKGDRNVGKTAVFLRLQGQKFKEEYLPTDEIQVSRGQNIYHLPVAHLEGARRRSHPFLRKKQTFFDVKLLPKFINLTILHKRAPSFFKS